MMKHLKLIFENADTTIAIVSLGSGELKRQQTKAELIARVTGYEVFKGLRFIKDQDISIEPLPNRHFEDCWRDDGTGNVHVDMPLARTQRMGEIRAERDRRFEPFDREWMKATGQKEATRADLVEAGRQLLRDIPQTVDLATITTPEALEAFEPAWPVVP